MDGLLSSEHEIMPGLIEMKKVVEPVRLHVENGHLLVENWYDFVDTSHLVATYKLEKLNDE